MGADPREGANGHWKARCVHPGHPDNNPSMTFSNGTSVGLIVNCFSCAPPSTDRDSRRLWLREVMAAVEQGHPLPPPSHDRSRKRSTRGGADRRLVKTYPYVDADGTVVAERRRYEPKDFNWAPTRTKPATLPLYRLPQLIAADHTDPVWITEGEKDAERLAGLGVVATCSPRGSAGPPEDIEVLRGRHVHLCVDRDRPGEKSRRVWTAALDGVAASVTAWHPIPAHEGADVSDHLDAGHSLDQLIEIEPDHWPTIVPLIEGSTMPFPVDALPAQMAAAVTEVAAAVMVDPALPAIAFLGAASGAVGMNTQVTISGDWQSWGNLYLAVVMDTGGGKTPATKPAWEPLRDLESQMQADADTKRREAIVMLPVLKSGLDTLRKQDRPPLQKMAVLQAQIEAAERTRSRDARLICDDITPERLAQLMADNDGRMVAVNDEGSLFRHMLGLYTGTPNLDPFLKSWDGATLTVDRKGGNGKEKTDIVIPDPKLTMVAAVQPVTIRSLGEPRHRDLLDRGVLGRVLVAWPQSTIGHRLMADRDHDHTYVHVPKWNAHVLRIGASGRTHLTLSNEARALFFSWHDDIERSLRPRGVYADVKASATKFRDCVARIAALFARLDSATSVGAGHMADAIQVGDYFLTHALAVAESWSGAPVDVARRLLTRITGPTFTVRDATRWVRQPKDTVLAALDVLDLHGYIRPEDAAVGYGSPGRTMGMASPVVRVNPAWDTSDPPVTDVVPPKTHVVPVVPGVEREETGSYIETPETPLTPRTMGTTAVLGRTTRDDPTKPLEPKPVGPDFLRPYTPSGITSLPSDPSDPTDEYPLPF